MLKFGVRTNMGKFAQNPVLDATPGGVASAARRQLSTGPN